MYEIRFSGSVEKFLKKTKEKGLMIAFQNAFNELRNDPYIGEMKVGDLSGIYGYDLFYRNTNYEIAYRIYEESEKLIVVILAGTRENFYQELKRHIK